jgi:hypothetical protein
MLLTAERQQNHSLSLSIIQLKRLESAAIMSKTIDKAHSNYWIVRVVSWDVD